MEEVGARNLLSGAEVKYCILLHIHQTESHSFSFRRQRARERQQKLLAEFASRQKSFMETAMDVGKKRPAHLFLSTCCLSFMVF